MGELVNVVVAVALIALVVRWFATGRSEGASGQPSPASILGFRPKTISDDMVTNVHAMFPDMPVDNIRYDLLRTGSTEITSNKILEKGYLEPPPQSYYRLYPRAETPQTAPTTTTTSAAKSTAIKTAPSLISRFNLQDRLVQTEEIDSLPETLGTGGSTKGVWEASPDKREQSLKERKAQMILAARKRLLDQERVEAKGKRKEK